MGIDAQRLDVHGGGDREFLAERLFLGVEVRQVLEVIGIDIAMGEQLIGVHAAGDLDDVQVQARVELLHVFEDLCVGNRVGGHAQGIGGRHTQRGQQRRQGKCSLQHSDLLIRRTKRGEVWRRRRSAGRHRGASAGDP